jgi:hypothetical protein
MIDLIMKKLSLGAFALIFFIKSGAQTNIDSAAPESAFTPIFNGTDLTGWKGDSTVWSVQDGALVGRLDHTPMGDHYLIWQGGKVGNFELRFDYWQPTDWKFNSGATGVRFRAQPNLGDERLLGYNVDIAGPSWYHTTLRDIEVPGQHRDLAFAGQSTRVQEVDGTNHITVAGRMAVTHAQLWADYAAGSWNQVSILAQNNRIQIRINGHLLNDCTDESLKRQRSSGLLALKLWMNQGPLLTARFKNLRLRRLDAGEAVPPPVFVSAPTSAPAGENKSKSPAADRLKQLESVYQQGLINKEDYEQKKKEILDSL